MLSKSARRALDSIEPDRESRSSGLAELADELMRRVREASLSSIDQGTDVLMDLESNGIRCVLVRTGAAHDVQLLSPREQEIARMIARGLPNKTIAAVLEISTWTVGTYLRRMFAKLHVSSRAALVARFLREPTDPR